jgi:formylmethanofuran dehydrogenase subunit B
MGNAWIDGRPVALQDAVNEAARMLGASRLPVIAGLGTDIAGAREAITLASRLGGVIDHMHSAEILRDLDVMREAGVMLTSPTEARLRGDVLLLVGAGPLEAAPELMHGLVLDPLAPAAGEDAERRIYWLCPGKVRGNAVVKKANIKTVGRDPADLPMILAALRAWIAGRPTGKVPISAVALDGLASGFKGAKFGVAVWSAAELDVLAIEMLCGIVKDLNGETRFTGLPLAASDNANGILQACGWMTGFPMRIGFGRSRPEHDPWRFDALRLAESGEADCALWISAYGARMPHWNAALPTIMLASTAAGGSAAARVQIAVGRPGIDHDAIEHHAATGTLSAVPAENKSDALSVAKAVEMIAAALPPARDARC